MKVQWAHQTKRRGDGANIRAQQYYGAPAYKATRDQLPGLRRYFALRQFDTTNTSPEMAPIWIYGAVSGDQSSTSTAAV
jgi:hypothetical protein